MACAPAGGFLCLQKAFSRTSQPRPMKTAMMPAHCIGFRCIAGLRKIEYSVVKTLVIGVGVGV